MINITPEEHKALYDILLNIASRYYSKAESFCVHTEIADILITFKR